jgi:hypothetical protein
MGKPGSEVRMRQVWLAVFAVVVVVPPKPEPMETSGSSLPLPLLIMISMNSPRQASKWKFTGEIAWLSKRILEVV